MVKEERANLVHIHVVLLGLSIRNNAMLLINTIELFGIWVKLKTNKKVNTTKLYTIILQTTAVVVML